MNQPIANSDANDTLIPAKVICHGPSHVEILIAPEDQPRPSSATQTRIVTEKTLGEGAFGIVLSGVMTTESVTKAHTRKTTEVAVKCSRKKMRGKELDRLREEVKIMSILTHPNIVRFHFACIFRDYVYIVMEKCERGNLHDVIKAHDGPLQMNDILFIGYQMVDAICYVHSKGCIHRDLKPGNFVFDHDGNVKLTDFGLSSSGNSGLIYDATKVDLKDDAKADARANANRRTVAGTYSYMAPEIMKQVILHQQNKHMEKGFRYSVEVDIYSLGVVLFYLATKTSPYWNSIREVNRNDVNAKKDSTKLLCEAVSQGRWQWPMRGKGNMEGISYDFMKLVESMLNYEGSRRPELRTIRRHHIWNERAQSISPLLLEIIQREMLPGDKRTDTAENAREQHGLADIQRQERDSREKLMQIRRNYESVIATQARELTNRCKLMSQYKGAMTKLSNNERDERIRVVLNRNEVYLGATKKSPEQRKMTPREIEVSGRYSFRASTLAAWSTDTPLSTRRSRGRKSIQPAAETSAISSMSLSQASPSPLSRGPRKSQARQYNPTPSQRSLRSHSKERQKRKTPSFWLDGPSQKFVSAPSPGFDFKKDVMKCPKKHPMNLMRSFPALNETTGGTNDYGWGFWCDNCHKEVPSLRNKRRRVQLASGEDERTHSPEENTIFYHCRCGYDLCKACGAATIQAATPKREELPREVKNLTESYDTPLHARRQEKSEVAKRPQVTPFERKTFAVPTQEEFETPHNMDDISDFALDLSPSEAPCPRPTFAPTEPVLPLTTFSPMKESKPLPPPHTPSNCVDNRFEKISTGGDGNPKSTRLWWENTSPLHQGSSPPSTVATEPNFIPPPHKVQPVIHPFSALNIEASPKLFSTPHPKPLTAEIEAPLSIDKAMDAVIPQQTPKGVHYVNTLITEDDENKVDQMPADVPEEIRSGKGWIWHYEVTYENGVLYVLYMTSENSFGCLVMNPEKLEYCALIYDKHRRSVFFIPTLKHDSKDTRLRSSYNHPHPYVKTNYRDHIIMLREADVLRLSTDDDSGSPLIKPPERVAAKDRSNMNDLPVHLTVLKDYAEGLKDFHLPFQTTANDPHVYLRKFFCDHNSEDDIQWYMFRLSNGHAIISSPKENMQIRWTTTGKVGKHAAPSYVPKYKFSNHDVTLYDDPAYFRKIRQALESIDDHTHRDVYDETHGEKS